MNPELLKLLGLAADATPEQVAAALQATMAPVYQVVFNKGHSEATKAKKAELETLTRERDAAKAEAEKAKTDLANAEKNKPDVAALRTQHAAEIQQLKDAHKAELQQRDETIRTRDRETAVGSTVAFLVGKGVDEVYARAMLADPATAKRIRHAQDGALEYLQDGAEIPIPVGANQKAHELFGETLFAKVPKHLIKSTADGGSGVQPGNDGGQKANIFESIRTEVAERGKKTDGQKVPSLTERLGMPPRS